MLGYLRKNIFFIIPTIFFIVYTAWWIVGEYEIFPLFENQKDLFTTTYGLLAAYGGLLGLVIAHKWGGLKSFMGKAIVFFSLGLLAQEFGQLAYSYYIYVQKIEVPYPSWGDLGYFATIPFYIIGAIYLARASGVSVSLKSVKSQIQAVLVPLVMLGYSYFIFLQKYSFDFSKPLTVFLDFGYPLGHATYVSMAFLTYLLSRKVLGGIMKTKILFILLAMCIQYIADFTFLYQVSREIWSVSGINDYMFVVGYFVMAIAIINLRVSTIRNKI